ncbi:eukaryotic translation initiation factor eIF2A [Trichinella nativa]|uniref:Eukaryotic translation initiation factor 2A n=1 Tax=Trichinella nativa TaxID=6335 RepID=A0A1Y3E8J8_9BILA|nr:eukaryotic translation initiation factor eIF2A [Trichinella nativa]
MAILDVDPQNKSYYGCENLHLMTTYGEACNVPLDREGPIHSVDWHPGSKLFCVVYGYIPSKAALFDLKANRVFDFGCEPRNEIFVVLLMFLCGFGSISGNIECWSMKDRKKISEFVAEDTTFFEISPDGIHFITATTSPRLRVSNGLKIWHCSGKVIHEINCIDETLLWQVIWSSEGKDKFPKPVIDLSSFQGAKAALTFHHICAARSKPNRPNRHSVKWILDSTETNRKLRQIKILKDKQSQGCKLELNQIEKINREEEIQAQLEQLTITGEDHG